MVWAKAGMETQANNAAKASFWAICVLWCAAITVSALRPAVS
jgi:hypothetical protein